MNDHDMRKLGDKLDAAARRIQGAAEIVKRNVAPHPPADVLTLPGWFKAGDLTYYADDSGVWVMARDGSGHWHKSGMQPSYAQEQCRLGNHHTIPVADALATLVYSIYVSKRYDADVIYRIDSPHGGEYCAEGGRWMPFGKQGVAERLHEVRKGHRRILTPAEANAISAPVPTLREAAETVVKEARQTTNVDMAKIERLAAAIAREKAGEA